MAIELKNAKVGLRCEFSQRCVKDKRERGQFGSWSKEYENRLGMVSIEKDHPDVVADLDIKEGDRVYVVWCEWSDGDSFGRSERGGVEAIGVFKDTNAAIAFAKFIEADNRSDEDSYSKVKTFKSEDGQEFTIRGYLPWNGYFEHLEEIHIQTVTVAPNIDLGDDYSSIISFS